MPLFLKYQDALVKLIALGIIYLYSLILYFFSYKNLTCDLENNDIQFLFFFLSVFINFIRDFKFLIQLDKYEKQYFYSPLQKSEFFYVLLMC